MRSTRFSADGAAGSAVVDLVLVMPLLLAVCTAAVQLAVGLVHRSQAADAAFSAARAAASAQVADRVRTARHEVDGLLGRSEPPVSIRVMAVAGVPSVVVEVPVPMRILGWEHPGSVTAHMALEPQ